jgi:hypothetical protein
LLPLPDANVPKSLLSLESNSPELIDNINKSQKPSLSNIEPDNYDLTVQIIQYLRKATTNQTIKHSFSVFLGQLNSMNKNDDPNDSQITFFRTAGPYTMYNSKNSPLLFAFNK